MKKPFFHDEMTIRHQFDRLCQMSLKGEAASYYRYMEYRRRHEAMFSELSKKELNRLFVMDEYGVENSHFKVYGYDIEVKDALIAEALQALSERKRNVILLSYFLEMSDADIAREMNLVRSTIQIDTGGSGCARKCGRFPFYMLQSGRLILPAVIQRRLPVSLFKQPVKMASVGKAQFVDDGGDAFIGAGEHDPRLFQVDGLSVFENGLAGVLLDDPVQIFSVVVQLGGQFFSGAASVTGFHDVGDLAEQIFLIV